MSMTLEEVAIAAKNVNVSEQVYMLLQIMNALGGGGSGDITKLVAPNSARGDEWVFLGADNTKAQAEAALLAFRTDNPTFIPLFSQVMTFSDGYYLYINYTI